MMSIAKVLIPAALAFAAFSASAGTIETDYPANVAPSMKDTASASDSGRHLIQRSQGPVEDAAPAAGSRSRDDVRREATQPRAFDLGYFS